MHTHQVSQMTLKGSAIFQGFPGQFLQNNDDPWAMPATRGCAHTWSSFQPQSPSFSCVHTHTHTHTHTHINELHLLCCKAFVCVCTCGVWAYILAPANTWDTNARWHII